MRNNKKKVSKRPTGIALSDGERADLIRLSELKYRGALGFTTVLREEGMEAVRAEIARLTKEKEETTS